MSHTSVRPVDEIEAARDPVRRTARRPERGRTIWAREAGRRLASRPGCRRLGDGVTRGDFYILCQDNQTTREQDERRILWAAGDIAENRRATKV